MVTSPTTPGGNRRPALSTRTKAETMKIFRTSGKDVFGCRAQLKADGFVFSGDVKAWYGTSDAVAKFNARGFRVKVFFVEQEDTTAARQIVGE